MVFNQKIKEDISDSLFRALVCLKDDNIAELSQVSDRTIHNSLIYQDKLSIELAVVMYALSKIIRERPAVKDEFVHLLEHGKELLDQNQYHAFGAVLTEVLYQIGKIDKNINQYTSHVISQAQVKKSSKLYYHGLSAGQSAAVLGISQWELYSYLGKTTINDDGSDSVTNLKKRLEYTRQLFSKENKNRVLIFDAGPIITMAMNSLAPLFTKIKQAFDGDFIIPGAVRNEVVNRPLETKSHKLEAFHVLPLITNGTFHVVESDVLVTKTQELEDLANSIYYAQGSPIRILHDGEMQCVALALLMASSTIVVDERTLRYIIETPSKLLDRLESRLHTHVTVNQVNLDKFKELTKTLRTIRSAELLTIAFEQDVLSSELDGISTVANYRQQYFQGLLWGLKLNGCGIGEFEIAELVKWHSQ